MPENVIDEKKFSEGRVAQCWDENADLWAEQVRKGWDGYREHFNNPEFFEFIGDLGGKTILDAGCGEGYNTRILAKKAAHVVGVDISKKLIDLAR
jgi:2-polyprenyl-3-methyl-5-hydroxy-6-metoxy-1,4-benzoquinol methylase